MSTSIPTNTDRLLNDGTTIPAVGFGVFRVADDQTETPVASAIQCGYRAIDTAAYYKNEVGTGKGIRSGGLPREQLHITTKVWHLDLGHERTIRSVERSLSLLGLDYLDLVLIHWPVPSRDLYVQSWEALITLRAQGLTKSIGVSNFNPPEVERIIRETGVCPAVNQVELHPRLPQADVRSADERHGILTQAWSPLGHGELLHHRVITEAATRLGNTPAQVLLRWSLDLGVMPITKSVNVDRIKSNLTAIDLLPLDDLAHTQLRALNNRHRTGPDPATYGA
jgi:2,5-diketo-D-gluconate reductase A